MTSDLERSKQTARSGSAPPGGVDHATLTALYEREWGGLNRIAFLLTDSRQTAEEIVQDAFVRLQSTTTRIENPGGYLRTVVVNACRDAHRHRQVVQRTPTPRVEPAFAEHDELFDALDRLPWKQRAALVLRYHVDLSERDIAAVLECRPATVRSTIHRALGALRKELSS